MYFLGITKPGVIPKLPQTSHLTLNNSQIPLDQFLLIKWKLQQIFIQQLLLNIHYVPGIFLRAKIIAVNKVTERTLLSQNIYSCVRK